MKPAFNETLLDAPTLWKLIEQRAEISAHRRMLIEAANGRTLSFADFYAQAGARAAWLYAQGIEPGVVTGWQAPTCIDTVLTCFALSRLGAIQVPIIHLYRERELNEVFRQSRPAFIIIPASDSGTDYAGPVHRAIMASGEAVQPLVVPSDVPVADFTLPLPPAEGSSVRWHYYSSGTTSRPKAVLHTDSSLIAAGRGYAGRLEITENDIGSVGFPFGHIGGVLYMVMALASGMSVLLLERFVPEEATAALHRQGVTLGGGSTAHYQALLAEQRRRAPTPIVPTLKVLAGGGAVKPAALFHQVRNEIGCTIVHAYGLTEAPISASNAPGDSDDQLAHSDGALMPGVEMRFLRNDGSPAAVGESGEILLRGPNVCQGYLDPEQTRQAFDSDGFFRTGDIGMMRPDGHVSITGRLKEIIIRKGENISVREIEELLLAHPKVRDAAVIGMPDEERGERVCAVIELVDRSDPLDFTAMRKFLEDQRLMRQKIPEQLEIMDAMPRNEGLQKVVKSKLREMLLQREQAAAGLVTQA
jgi:acyl-CoA synthetase (AMP-forming)/AMP-acid ligase II